MLHALALLALATSFDARLAQAEAAAATRAGYAYDMALAPAVHAAMLPCVPKGRATALKAGAFTAVASVDATGRVSDVQVRPATPLSRCFARQLSATRLPPPPRPAGHAKHPVLIRIRDAF